jgi:hypothetical protein
MNIDFKIVVSNRGMLLDPWRAQDRRPWNRWGKYGVNG